MTTLNAGEGKVEASVEAVARVLARRKWPHVGGDAYDALVRGTPNWMFCVDDAKAAIDAMWSIVDLALLDFPSDDPEGFARGHEHAKSVVREKLRTVALTPKDPEQ